MNQDLVTKIEDLVDLLHKIFSANKTPIAQTSSWNEWVDHVDIKRILKLSDSSIYRLRKKQILRAKRVSGKWYYRLPDFENLDNT